METYTLKLVIGDDQRQLAFVGPAGARAIVREASDWATDHALEAEGIDEALALTVHAMKLRGFEPLAA